MVHVIPGWEAAIALPSEGRAPATNRGLCFFARSNHDPKTLLSLIAQFTDRRKLHFSWLPWGDRLSFPLLPQFEDKSGLQSLFGEEAPSLSTLLWAVKNAELVITDTYHLSVIAWSLGTPAIMLTGGLDSATRDVNAGHIMSRADKRVIFYQQNSLGELLITQDIASDEELLVSKISHIDSLDLQSMTRTHVARARNLALLCEAQLKWALEC